MNQGNTSPQIPILKIAFLTAAAGVAGLGAYAIGGEVVNFIHNAASLSPTWQTAIKGAGALVGAGMGYIAGGYAGEKLADPNAELAGVVPVIGGVILGTVLGGVGGYVGTDILIGKPAIVSQISEPHISTPS